MQGDYHFIDADKLVVFSDFLVLDNNGVTNGVTQWGDKTPTMG